MSTVAEHLALLEFYREMRYDRNPVNRAYSDFTMEASLFCEVHLNELVAGQSPGAMEEARLEVEKRLRGQHPDAAERLIAAWKTATTAQTDAFRKSAPGVAAELQGGDQPS